VLLCLPETPHGLTWDWTWASVLRLVTEPWHSQILNDWFNSMKLHQLHDLYEMLIVKCDLERWQMELFVTHFEIFQHLPAGSHNNQKPVYAASSSLDTKHNCWSIYQSVLHAIVSLCTAYTLCSVGMCKSACSTHTVKQWLVHITFLILGHQTLWWRQTNPLKWLNELCYGLLVWVHLFVMTASNVTQREKRYALTFCAYPGKTGLYTYPLQFTVAP
jgi:hypothetical protein